MSQDAIKTNDGKRELRTVEFVIDNRHPHPAHVRDLLLLAASGACTDEQTADGGVLEMLEMVEMVDIIDIVHVAARLVQGQLQALTSGIRSAQDRCMTATEAFALAQSIAADPRAVGAVGTVVGALADGDRSTAAAIARCVDAFSPAELADAAVALCAANLILIGRGAGVSVAEVVRWSAGDGAEHRTAARTVRRPMFCTRDAVDTADRVGAPRR